MRKTIKNESLYKKLSIIAYSLKKTDLVAAAKMMALAFSADPSIRYLLGGTSMGSQDWKYFYCVLKSVFGRCVMLSENDSLNNLLILFPPYLKSVPIFSFFCNGGFGLLRLFGPSLFRRSLNYENNCISVKKSFVSLQMWYCMCFVVSPQMQGKGKGSQLIKPILDVFDSNGISLYLETHKTVNVSIYEHLGFTAVNICTIPGTDITQYAMIRK